MKVAVTKMANWLNTILRKGDIGFESTGRFENF